MKTKLILATETKDMECWTDLPFIPRQNEWFNVQDILQIEELKEVKQAAQCWSGVRGTVQSIEYRQNNNGLYTEIFIWCED